MKKIVRIYTFEEQKKVVIKISQSDSISLSLVQYENLKDQLKVGTVLTPEFESELTALQTKFKISSRLERYLSLRPHSRKEIQDYLKFKIKLSPDQVQEYLKELAEMGFIDDFAFSDWYVSGKIASNKAKQIKIRMELMKKGISQEIITNIFSEIDFESSSVEEINNLAQKLRIRIQLSKPELRPNQVEFLLTQKLAQRGYSLKQIKKAFEDN